MQGGIVGWECVSVRERAGVRAKACVRACDASVQVQVQAGAHAKVQMRACVS